MQIETNLEVFQLPEK